MRPCWVSCLFSARGALKLHGVASTGSPSQSRPTQSPAQPVVPVHPQNFRRMPSSWTAVQGPMVSSVLFCSVLFSSPLLCRPPQKSEKNLRLSFCFFIADRFGEVAGERGCVVPEMAYVDKNWLWAKVQLYRKEILGNLFQRCLEDRHSANHRFSKQDNCLAKQVL